MSDRISSYSFSLVGKDHLYTGTPCQDYSDIIYLQNGWTIAAVADGVGSALRSDEGSKIAVTSALSFCSENFPTSIDAKNILAMLLLSFHRAFGKIRIHAENELADLEDFDTTLTVVCFYKGMLFYGHCGDGGIFVVNRFGEASEVTIPQKGDDPSSVIPLRFGPEHWVFDQHSENVPVVLLATDGVRDRIASNNFCNSTFKLYVPLLLFLSIIFDLSSRDRDYFTDHLKELFAENSSITNDWIYDRLLNVYENNNIPDAKTIVEQIRSNNNLYSSMSRITDDISIAVLNDPNIPIMFNMPDMPNGYFSEPDWQRIKREIHRELYPHLYSQDPQAVTYRYSSSVVQQTDDLPLTVQQTDDLSLTVQQTDDLSLTVQQTDDLPLTVQQTDDLPLTVQQTDDLRPVSSQPPSIVAYPPSVVPHPQSMPEYIAPTRRLQDYHAAMPTNEQSTLLNTEVLSGSPTEHSSNNSYSEKPSKPVNREDRSNAVDSAAKQNLSSNESLTLKTTVKAILKAILTQINKAIDFVLRTIKRFK